MSIKDFFTSKKPENIEQKPVVKKQKRAFKGARNGRLTTWLFSSFNKINLDTKQDLVTLITRCRDLSKNNEIMRSHLNNFEKNIIRK